MESERSFKAGDIARIKYQPNVRVFIIEVQHQTCYAGVTQTWYTVRQYGAGKYGGIAKEFTRVSSIELEPLPSVSVEIKEMLSKFKVARANKEKLIKEQKFDEAATARDQERLLKNELEAKLDLLGLSLEEVLNE